MGEDWAIGDTRTLISRLLFLNMADGVKLVPTVSRGPAADAVRSRQGLQKGESAGRRQQQELICGASRIRRRQYFDLFCLNLRHGRVETDSRTRVRSLKAGQ
jgi:hypothetical protein